MRLGQALNTVLNTRSMSLVTAHSIQSTVLLNCNLPGRIFISPQTHELVALNNTCIQFIMTVVTSFCHREAERECSGSKYSLSPFLLVQVFTRGTQTWNILDFLVCILMRWESRKGALYFPEDPVQMIVFPFRFPLISML